MLLKEAYHQLQSGLHTIYDNRESGVIADWIMEDITKWTKSQRIIHQDYHLTREQEVLLTTFKDKLLAGKPLQYVLGYTWFKGHRFTVDEHVLIPRPETEELVDLILKVGKARAKKDDTSYKVLDIGTGSGCIAISLELAYPEWEVWGIDKSTSALTVASRNAKQLNASVNFKQIDILMDPPIDHLPAFDLIVSNPPYIPLEEMDEMTTQIVEHEPHMALFVTNNDPLQFYKAILKFSEHHLIRGGAIWLETHMAYAGDVSSLLQENDYVDVAIHKDFQGKERIVRGTRAGASL